MSKASYGTETIKQRKRVLYEGTDTIYEGMALCYIYDTTTNVIGYSRSEGGDEDSQTTPTTTDEGYQNECKFQCSRI